MGLLDLFDEKFREPADAVVRVDGEEITDLYPSLVEISVECTRNRWCQATLRFESVRDESGRWRVQDEEILVPWKPIVIEAAFGERTEEVMQGYIQQVGASYPEQTGAATVTVSCRDTSLKLDREHVRTTWGTEEVPTSDSDILREILSGRHQLLPHPDSGRGQSGLVQQHQNSTDIRFLKQRADANGYEIYFEKDALYFGPMRLDAAPQETIMVYAGDATNCLRFDVTTDGHRPDRVAYDVSETEGDGVVAEVVSPDLPLLGTSAAGSEGAGLDDFVWKMSRKATRNQEELAALALAKANEFSMRVRARGELDGSLYGHVLRVGQPVEVDGIGNWLGGIYYVDAVTHNFGVDGYRQSMQLLRNAYGDNL